MDLQVETGKFREYKWVLSEFYVFLLLSSLIYSSNIGLTFYVFAKQFQLSIVKMCC